MYPKIIQELIDKFARLPSIGPKTAERMVFYLLNKPASELHQLGEAIENIKGKIKICKQCFNFSETNPCHICRDDKRDKKIICVITKPQDLLVIEKTKHFNGQYHILGGNINPLENISPENIKIKELLSRIKIDQIEEVILAFNPDMPGETTTLYLKKLLKQNFPDLVLTRLARGLPMGADLEYADEVTLENALARRQGI